jgi:hypothetical protein
MNDVFPLRRDKRRRLGMRQVLLHAVVAVLAIVIAFSLPLFAEYVLFQWWPRVAQDPNLLMATEVALAATLVLMFNAVHIAWEDRSKVRAADMAALVYARHRSSWLARWRERRLVSQLPATRDAYMLTLTGFDTFAAKTSLLRDQLAAAYDIRVLLLNPNARSAQRRVDSLPDEVTLRTFCGEVEASLAYLQSLITLGKKVTVKFYEQEPFWKIAVLDDHVWVQYCHRGVEIKNEPEFVFALNRDNPRVGLFVPFYMYFLDRWEDPRHPEYDFETKELVYRDKLGNEIGRETLDDGMTSGKPVAVAAA